jgi:hypothetical protein
MNTVVWIMVMFSYGQSLNTGPEFSTKEKCEAAAKVIADSGTARFMLGKTSTPWCVRIEK